MPDENKNKLEQKNNTKDVVTIGFVSLFTDMSTQMIFPLLPLFISTVLGAGPAFLGMIEGIGEALASTLRVFSGSFSDKIKKRKPVMFSGYLLSSLAKPFFYIATSAYQVLAVRLVERIGKGVRAAPRDALIADYAHPTKRGLAFGLQKSMDRFGSFLGPLIAWLILANSHNNIRLVFLLATIPAFLAVAIIIFFVKEKSVSFEKSIPLKKISFKKFKPKFKPKFKRFLLVMAVFSLGDSSEAFLLLRAQDVGITPALIPIVWLMYNLVESMVSMPIGKLSDHIGRSKTILYGFILYVIVYLGLAIGETPAIICILIATLGIYYGISECVMKAYIADVVDNKRVLATGYGIYSMIIGIFSLPASLIMGIVWQKIGPAPAFAICAFFALVGTAMFAIFTKAEKT